MGQKHLVALIGAPCAGKSTIGRQLNAEYWSSGDTLRRLAAGEDNLSAHIRQLAAYGGYLDDDLMMNIFYREMARLPDGLAFVDGVPRTIRQKNDLDASESHKEFVMPYAIFFDCPKDVLEERYKKRSKEGRTDDKVSYDERFSIFCNNTRPVVDAYEQEGRLRVIDASQPIDVVLTSVLNELERT